MAKMKRNIGDVVSGNIFNVVFVNMNGKLPVPQNLQAERLPEKLLLNTYLKKFLYLYKIKSNH